MPPRAELRALPRHGGGPLSSLDALVDGFVDRTADAVIERIAPLLERPAAPMLIDRRELAAALSVGVDTVDRIRREGCPELTVGDAPRFRLEAVLAWLEAREGRK